MALASAMMSLGVGSLLLAAISTLAQVNAADTQHSVAFSRRFIGIIFMVLIPCCLFPSSAGYEVRCRPLAWPCPLLFIPHFKTVICSIRSNIRFSTVMPIRITVISPAKTDGISNCCLFS